MAASTLSLCMPRHLEWRPNAPKSGKLFRNSFLNTKLRTYNGWPEVSVKIKVVLVANLIAVELHLSGRWLSGSAWPFD